MNAVAYVTSWHASRHDDGQTVYLHDRTARESRRTLTGIDPCLRRPLAVPGQVIDYLHRITTSPTLFLRGRMSREYDRAGGRVGVPCAAPVLYLKKHAVGQYTRCDD